MRKSRPIAFESMYPRIIPSLVGDIYNGLQEKKRKWKENGKEKICSAY
jgi:hypothetical protein